MHILHRILVPLTNGNGLDKIADRMELIDSARSYAESETEEFYPSVYDWRETDTAGRWSDRYPENVLLGKECPEHLLKEVEKCQQAQKDTLNEHLKALTDISGDKLSVLVQKITDYYDSGKTLLGDTSLTAYRLNCLSMILSGKYYYDSYFYDTDSYTARIDLNTIQKIKENPDNWALVLFDCHY